MEDEFSKAVDKDHGKYDPLYQVIHEEIHGLYIMVGCNKKKIMQCLKKETIIQGRYRNDETRNCDNKSFLLSNSHNVVLARKNVEQGPVSQNFLSIRNVTFLYQICSQPIKRNDFSSF